MVENQCMAVVGGNIMSGNAIYVWLGCGACGPNGSSISSAMQYFFLFFQRLSRSLDD